MNRDYQLGCFSYVPAGLFYLLSIYFTIGVFCSVIIDPNINALIRIIIMFIYSFILIFTLYYHFKSMTISNKIHCEENLIISPNEIEGNNLYCNICKIKRPKRAHHCRICGVCILKMDHHCPWIANCVGEKNEREFLYFLFGSTTSCIFIFFLTLKYFFDYVQNPKKYNYHNNIQYNYYILVMKDIMKSFRTFTCPLSFALGLVSFLIIWSFINNNVKYNMTAVEMLIYRDYEKCPDYNNNLKENLKRILKPYPIINSFIGNSEDINDEFEYKNFNEENIKLLKFEK